MRTRRPATRLAEHSEAQATRDERLLAELESALGLADQLRLEDLDSRLGGQRLEQIAVGLLRTERQFGEAIHYKERFDLVRRTGHEIGGKVGSGSDTSTESAKA